MSYHYDANGNTLTETEDGRVTRYSYDARNKLVETTRPSYSATYGYNADGIRTRRTENGATTQFVVDSNRDYAQVLAEVSNGTTEVSYTYGDDLLAQQRSGATSYYLYDGHGSTRALADEGSTVTDTYHYDAFGVLLASTGDTENDYLYTGEQRDAGLEQYYLRARYYDQGVGRFTQMDTWMGHNSDPVTLHKYLYGNADPATFTDPTGNFGLAQINTALRVMGNLATRSVSAGRSMIDRLLVGRTRFTASAGGTGSSNLGFIGNMVVQEMRHAVQDAVIDYALNGIDIFSNKPVFGTKAHSYLEERIKRLNTQLQGKFRMAERWGIEVKAEAYFRPAGNGDRAVFDPSCRRCGGSFGIDVTILRGKNVLKAFDLKTGRGWSGRERRRRANAMGAGLFEIFVVPKRT